MRSIGGMVMSEGWLEIALAAEGDGADRRAQRRRFSRFNGSEEGGVQRAEAAIEAGDEVRCRVGSSKARRLSKDSQVPPPVRGQPNTPTKSDWREAAEGAHRLAPLARAAKCEPLRPWQRRRGCCASSELL
jgi:hypothetical protein